MEGDTIMTRQAKRQLIEQLRPRYIKATKKERSAILDTVIYATGYHRKYAISLLRHGYPRQVTRSRKRHRKYQWLRHILDQRVVNALLRIWRVLDHICANRLHPFLPEATHVLERHQELVLDEETKALLSVFFVLAKHNRSVGHVHRVINQQQ